MKRYRAVDVPPKFRRTAKGGRNTRLGDSVYFSRFFSAYNLVYLKFFLMWVCCIALDFLIGFRFELLWPVWLLARHLYESFRVHAISSSLHYSAFSVFFVCVTATSDLVCYLFIPIQVLIFLASTYVWVQFVYQSSDRGVCLPSLFLWALFIVFEYSVRYRFDNATWYLTRTSWITAGLFPSTADSVSIGLSANSSSSSSPSSTRLELYRPFAAHSIGFPVVTLGFRVKSFFSNWRLRVRREEVMRQNEFFERLLAEAIPTSFDNRKHFISSRSHLSIDQQEALACMHSKPTTEQHNGPMTIYRDTMAISGTGNALYQNSNGRTVGLNSSSGSSPTVLQQQQRQFSSISQQKTLMQPPLSVCSSTFNSTLEQLLHATQNMSYSLSPFDSNGGTNGAEHGGITYNANGMLNNNSNSGSSTCSGATSKKSRRSRVVSSISQTSTVPVVAADASSSISLSTPGVSTLYNSNNANIKLGDADLNNEFCGGVNNLLQHQQHEGGDNNNNSECSLLRENAQRLSEIRQLQKERQTLELSFDKIKSELKSARSTEHELRLQLSSVQQREQCCREEWKQFERDQKQRVDQLESKCKQLSKQNDYYKLNTQALERRVGELQLKKSEIERELTNERLRNSARDEPVGKPQHNATSDNGEFKQKLASQDRELKALRKESKAKTEQNTKFEEELRQLRTAKSDGSKQMEIMRQKNFLLEQTLSSENKLKQDLFRALNDSKAEIATLKARLHSKQINEQQGGAMNNYRDTMATSGTGNALYQNSNGGGRIVGLNSSSGSSPTVLQQQQRQFSSISQQKSLTPPPLSVGSSTFNSTLEQLLQATQNMSYSLSPLDSNGGTNGAEHGGITYNANGMLNNNVNSGSSTFGGVTTSDMLAVGGHRSVGGNTNAGAAVKDGSSGNN